uniref:T3F20.7 protein n=1 Tax=Arabidopsis thaliana TaxID=3702 RepID=Q9LPH7_ARATH|nr:Contains similarity to Kv2 voltage-gated potassium channel from Loligo pealei gb/Y14390 [Arabidopsis thaliana]AAX55092.1 hypothetical protein At1g53610 [Arabidopsis thaliana]
MEPVVNVVIAVSACVIFALIVIGCVSYRKKEPLSQPRDLETGVTGTKDGGLVVLTGNDATTAVVAAAVTTDDYNGCCCGGGGDGGGDGGGCGGCGGCGG